MMDATKLISVLLAEDNEDDVVIMKDAFEQANMINLIHVVNDGDEVMAYLRNEGAYRDMDLPGLILLDINMPKKNGFEVLEEVKNDPDLKHIPIIMLTTSSRDEDIAKSYKNGACSYITKPVHFNKFIDVMKQFAVYWALVSKIPKSA